ncbi:hypothetical protein GQ472_00720 [archaeon]|nr:hypothetical protein [archaeon]
MRKFRCDRCHKIVAMARDLNGYDGKTGEFQFEEHDCDDHRYIDLCKDCSIELDKLKKEILKENRHRIQDWFKGETEL